jgi:glycosyl transferase family 2
VSTRGERAGGAGVDGDLWVRLETALPTSLPVGRATAVFVFGACFHRRQDVRRLELSVDGRWHRVRAAAMPRLDVVRALHPAIDPTGARSPERDPDSADDPELRCYRSGFWATVPIERRDRPGRVELRLEAELADGTRSSRPLGAIDVVAAVEPPIRAEPAAPGPGLIAVCMATFEPHLELFRAQVDSLRAQSDERWVCLISDDCSGDERFAAIEEVIAGDRRFAVSRSPRRLGFYRNFERALELAPADAALVALCDQDDRWYPEKLAALREAIGGAELVYSDQRLVDADGRVIAESLWGGRRNNFTSLASMLVANTVTGAASMFRRELLDFALPFPEMPGWQFHDHWLALVALATGGLAYVDRPLYDYVQHPGAILGQVMVEPAAAEAAPPARRRGRLRAALAGGRSAYFCAYLRIEVQAQAILARCPSRLAPRKRRALARFVAADRSPLALAWLAARPLRGLVGRNETLGAEGQLARGILWRRLLALRTRGHRRPRGVAYDASYPPCGPDGFSQRRLRRWRSRR